MNPKIINQLEKINDANTKKLASLIKGELPKVDASYYQSTVFSNEKEYDMRADYFDCQIVGKYQPKLWNNSLIFIPGNDEKVVASKKEQGIGMGVVLLDYISKEVQVAATIDKDGEDYSYTSTTYNKSTKSFETISEKSSCSDFKSLLSFFSTKLGEDIAKFND